MLEAVLEGVLDGAVLVLDVLVHLEAGGAIDGGLIAIHAAADDTLAMNARDVGDTVDGGAVLSGGASLRVEGEGATTA